MSVTRAWWKSFHKTLRLPQVRNGKEELKKSYWALAFVNVAPLTHFCTTISE
jgi:hypothetical protein